MARSAVRCKTALPPGFGRFVRVWRPAVLVASLAATSVNAQQVPAPPGRPVPDSVAATMGYPPLDYSPERADSAGRVSSPVPEAGVYGGRVSMDDASQAGGSRNPTGGAYPSPGQTYVPPGPAVGQGFVPPPNPYPGYGGHAAAARGLGYGRAPGAVAPGSPEPPQRWPQSRSDDYGAPSGGWRPPAGPAGPTYNYGAP